MRYAPLAWMLVLASCGDPCTAADAAMPADGSGTIDAGAFCELLEAQEVPFCHGGCPFRGECEPRALGACLDALQLGPADCAEAQNILASPTCARACR